jgi:CheY-like chemotaxis protein
LARRETKLGKKRDTTLQVEKPNLPLRVLVVEDNPDTADTVRLLLELLGHDVCVASDGATALRAASTFRPGVALLDILLPRGMNGYQVARQLRQQDEFQGILLIAMTGYAQEKDRQDAYAAGFDHHLAKPFTLEELKRLLATARC